MREEATGGRHHLTVNEAKSVLPGTDGERFAKVLEHVTMEVEVYAPRGTDTKQPYACDELYVVVNGSGGFVNGLEPHPFGPGDVLGV